MSLRSSKILNKATVQEIITDKSIVFHFQPIISAGKKRIVGYEGLMRGIDKHSNTLISPLVLYESAKKHDMLLELDRLCREQCLRSFRERVYSLDEGLMVFLNFEISLLSEGNEGALFMINLLSDLDISPNNVVIEIIESKVKKVDALKRFIDILKYYGFLIALDDVGVGHSNFDRIPIVKPNIIKIDRSIITGIERDYYKQEILKALVNLCRKIGSIVLAEGVETKEEVLWTLSIGADLLQGYYFSKPLDTMFNDLRHELFDKIDTVVALFNNRAIQRLKRARKDNEMYDRFVDNLCERLKNKDENSFQSILEEQILKVNFVDSIFILNKQGIQVTDTVMVYNINKPKNPLFRPARKGDDLSSKEYFYLLVHTGLKRYITDSYISHASGNRCRTISVFFKGSGNSTYILCVDIIETSEYYYKSPQDDVEPL
ncbi:MAG: EAL domain-containing protein [Thermodesulfovibrionales bacterium]|nr:EAL domain-containing protein [Thermodesulfovibrionales bacterium]